MARDLFKAESESGKLAWKKELRERMSAAGKKAAAENASAGAWSMREAAKKAAEDVKRTFEEPKKFNRCPLRKFSWMLTEKCGIVTFQPRITLLHETISEQVECHPNEFPPSLSPCANQVAPGGGRANGRLDALSALTSSLVSLFFAACRCFVVVCVLLSVS